MTAPDPCPRCGSACEAVSGPVPDRWGVRCIECGLWADDREGTEAEAIAAWNRRAIPAREVGVDVEEVARAIYDAMRFERKDKTPEWVKGGNSNAQVKARSTAARILAVLAPTDAAHVNETPKSEHDAGNVLTAAQAREAALWEAWNVVWEAKTLLDAKNALHALIGEART